MGLKKRVVRIKISELPQDKKVSEKEMRAVKGGTYTQYALAPGGPLLAGRISLDLGVFGQTSKGAAGTRVVVPVCTGRV